MEADLLKFKEHIKNETIRTNKKLLTDAICSFSFDIINQENNPLEQKLIESEFLIINQLNYIDDQYLIITFDRQLFIINEKNTESINPFINSNRKSTVFIFQNSDSIIQRITRYLKGIGKIISNDNNLNTEINDFLEYLSIFPKEIKKFWDFIKFSISAYLIINAHKNSQINRVLKYQKYLNANSNRKLKLKDDDYISLRIFKSGCPFVHQIYDIKNEKIYILKAGNIDNLNIREKNNYLNLFHPLIPKYIGEATFQGIKGILIEYIDGFDLSKIKEMNLKLNEKLRILFEIMIVIEYLHNKNYVYRDLKPVNIMLDKNLNSVIIDFDRMVKNEEQIKLADHSVIQGEFLSPEILEAKPFSYPTDIYSIGKIIQFLFDEELKKSNQNDFSKICKSLKYLSDKCLNMDPNKRPIISELINNFFISIYSKITNQTLNNQNLKFLNHMHTNEYKEFWFLTVEIENSNCQYDLACIYVEGKIVNQDINMSIKLFSAAADKNNSNAMHNLGYLYEKFKHDIPKSNEYYKKAAQLGNVYSQFNLGKFYLDSNDIEKSIYYFELAAKQNYLDAIMMLALIYNSDNKYYYCLNVNKSLNYLHMACKLNYIDAFRLIGLVYYHDIGVPKDVNKSIFYFEKAADQNNLEAILMLGYIYSYSHRVPKDINKSIFYYKKAADDFKDKEAQYYLGCIHYNKELGVFDINKAIKYFSLAANQNDAQCNLILGNIYFFKRYIDRDIKKAIYYYSIAAKLNHPDALVMLGNFYRDGKFVEKNINKAIYYYSLAAKQNFPWAQLSLGRIYLYDDNIKKDIKKGLSYLYSAADQNLPEAQLNLGYSYIYDKNIPRNLDLAFYFFNLAANQKCYEAYFYLGHFYWDQNNEIKAIYYFSEASKSGHGPSSIALGTLYNSSFSIPKDLDRSFYYYSLALKQGDVQSYSSLGDLYYNKNFKNRDLNKAIKYHEIGASYGNINSLSFLGDLYFYGNEVPQNIDKAIKYFSLAAAKNFEPAECMLGLIYYKEKYGKKDIKKALDYLIDSANRNYSGSQYILAKIYEKGIVIEKDFKKAIYYYEQAAKQQFKPAYYKLALLYHRLKKMKEALHYYYKLSSLNYSLAKNNLGVIYKNGEGVTKNIAKALMYFEEAIKMNNKNFVAKYNLAHLYFYGDDGIEVDLDKSISLLVETSDIFDGSLELLGLVLVKKYKNKLTYENIQSEVKSKKLCNRIYEKISKCAINDINVFEDLYYQYQEIDYLFYSDKNAISIQNFYKYDIEKEKKNSKARDITRDFYIGFGIDLT